MHLLPSIRLGHLSRFQQLPSMLTSLRVVVPLGLDPRLVVFSTWSHEGSLVCLLFKATTPFSMMGARKKAGVILGKEAVVLKNYR